MIENKIVDWDEVVKISTEHYVFPALYYNLKRKELLSYLPEDLAAYMRYISDLNEERNLQIRKQALEINNLLKAQNISPIFLKGTGFLLQGFYDSIAERMIGDIDFIIAPEEYEVAIEVLKNNGYNNKARKLDNVKLGKHYPRMTHKDHIAAVEVHFRILKEPYDKTFNFNFVKDHTTEVGGKVKVFNFDNQVLHTIFNKQTNDLGYWYKTISLRNCYDLFLLSKRTDTHLAIQSIPEYFDILNTFLASCSYVFDGVPSILFENNKKAKSFVKHQIELLDSPKKMRSNKKVWQAYFTNKSRLKKLRLAFINKDVRGHLFNLIFKR